VKAQSTRSRVVYDAEVHLRTILPRPLPSVSEVEHADAGEKRHLSAANDIRAWVASLACSFRTGTDGLMRHLRVVSPQSPLTRAQLRSRQLIRREVPAVRSLGAVMIVD
jgi:hypothetical protein